MLTKWSSLCHQMPSGSIRVSSSAEEHRWTAAVKTRGCPQGCGGVYVCVIFVVLAARFPHTKKTYPVIRILTWVPVELMTVGFRDWYAVNAVRNHQNSHYAICQSAILCDQVTMDYIQDFSGHRHQNHEEIKRKVDDFEVTSWLQKLQKKKHACSAHFPETDNANTVSFQVAEMKSEHKHDILHQKDDEDGNASDGEDVINPFKHNGGFMFWIFLDAFFRFIDSQKGVPSTTTSHQHHNRLSNNVQTISTKPEILDLQAVYHSLSLAKFTMEFNLTQFKRDSRLQLRNAVELESYSMRRRATTRTCISEQNPRHAQTRATNIWNLMLQINSSLLDDTRGGTIINCFHKLWWRTGLIDADSIHNGKGKYKGRGKSQEKKVECNSYKAQGKQEGKHNAQPIGQYHPSARKGWKGRQGRMKGKQVTRVWPESI